MALNLPIVDAVTGLFSGLIGAIDDWHTSDEEKLIAKGNIFKAQANLLGTVFDYEKSMMQMQADIITSEAKSEHWLVATWRPITMLVFVALVAAHWFGFTPENMTQETIDNLFLLVQIGLGGYVVGRSAEKVAKSINFKDATTVEDPK